ncbi:Auxin Efflux Carrier [Methylobacterium nodulans ORS 2060]|uniref:Auxin Efflux Carrier n=1 Tax=Methylobacterium nodulans (strain LMG 21967 / CNCM I-2342 / ORS 2060) TaxID=460265 RepID=B8IKD2_METNO|nr:Auxin Efflux Carrier [Methylobacterium nodulans ORS 2060]
MDFQALFDLLAPFFGLIAVGWAAGRFVPRPEGPAGFAWLQFYVIYVALPCLFFRLVSDKPLGEVMNGRFVAGTTLATGLAFALSLAIGLRASRGALAEATLQGMAGSYANIGYMGPPLVLGALGPASGAPVALVFVFDSLFLFTLVPLLMALSGHERRSLAAALGTVLVRVATHPFNLAAAAGVVWGALQWRLPIVLDRISGSLAQTAAPTALFMLGLTVALRPARLPPPEVAALVTVKLLVHPLIALGLLTLVGGLPPVWIAAGVLMAALPPALNIFVVSSQYGLGTERASACLLAGTLASILTLTAFVWAVKGGWLVAGL